MSRFVLLVLLLASALRPAGAQLAASSEVAPTLVAPRWGLFVVANASLTIDASSTSPLDRLGDQEIAWIEPLAGGPAVKVHAEPARRILLDDVDAQQPWHHDWGDLDALDLRRHGWTPTRPAFDDLVVSVQDAFAQALEGTSSDFDGAVDGSLFRVTRSAHGAKLLRFFLTEKQVLRALGHNELPVTDGVDVDAFTQDAQGNVYLSFRTDEIVIDTWVGDAGLVCIPATAITYTGTLDVASVEASSAVIVWDEADADAMVANAQLTEADGDAIEVLGDLQAVTIDPAGGGFPSREPIPGLGPDAPNMLFAGQRVGASVLSTRAGGSVARLDGVALAASPIGGGALGFEASATTKPTHDLNALCAARAHRPGACLDLVDDWVMLDAEPFEVHVAGHAPGTPIVLLFGVDPPSAAPDATPSFPAPAWAEHPHVHTLGPAAVLAVADESGRTCWTAPPPPADVIGEAWITLQAWGLGDGRLSTPARVWCELP